PKTVVHGLQSGWARTVPSGPHRAIERIEARFEIQIGRQSPDQRRVLPLPAPTRHAEQSYQQVRALLALRRHAEDVQPVADLHLLQFAEIIVELRQCLARILIRRETAVAVEAGAPAEVQ